MCFYLKVEKGMRMRRPLILTLERALRESVRERKKERGLWACGSPTEKQRAELPSVREQSS